ncbi:helix-turn-helix domain-containing protein [Paenibacillus sp. NPDC056722]|uniref:helix-turn-helix domain-containing protein n=1 Tax=Paenibacillus sp. NPDC056722 TaxID=3345924 RepID=UPI003694A291
MNYISIRQASEIWGISSRRVQVLCTEGRIPGVTRLGKSWAIPSHAKKPADARIKSGKYITTD